MKNHDVLIASNAPFPVSEQDRGGTPGIDLLNSPVKRTMRFLKTRISGAYLIEPERNEDDRGFFARTFSAQEFERHGLNPAIAQCSISFNPRKGTLRGMHYQAEPYAETKLVRCTRGAIHDVLVDLRNDSPTFLQWIAVELSAENGSMLAIPEGLAHGFQTLRDNTEVTYQISEFYHPECSRGVRWDDPAIGIEWPLVPSLISPHDANFALMVINGKQEIL